MKESTNEWLPLAQHERWIVEYRPDSRMVRLCMDEVTLYLEREAYQLLWGLVTLGLDKLERVERVRPHGGAGARHRVAHCLAANAALITKVEVEKEQLCA